MLVRRLLEQQDEQKALIEEQREGLKRIRELPLQQRQRQQPQMAEERVMKLPKPTAFNPFQILHARGGKQQPSEEQQQQKRSKLAALEAELEGLKNGSEVAGSEVAGSPGEGRRGALVPYRCLALRSLPLRNGGTDARYSKNEFSMIAEEMYKYRSNDFKTNHSIVKNIFLKYESHFRPLLEKCPQLNLILAHMMVLRLGIMVNEVSWTSDMKDWTETDLKRVGRSMATILRFVQTGTASVDAWRKQYVLGERAVFVFVFAISPVITLIAN